MLLLLLLLLGLGCSADEAGFCLRSISPPDAIGFERGSRRMPARTPALAAYDWASGAADQHQLTAGYKPCHVEAPIFRYKVVNGVVYVDHDHSDARYKQYRDVFLEQLVLAMWLYNDFPDVDIVVDFADHPQLCEQHIPFLRFSIFNASGLGSTQQQRQYNITDLLAPAWVPQGYASRLAAAAAPGQQEDDMVLPPYTRGFAVPSPEAWRALSLTQPQLLEYQRCLQETYPWAAKRLVIFWRGQATGCSRGWPMPRLLQAPSAAADGTEGGANTAAAAAQPQPHLLRNKRVQAVLRLFPYVNVADVGLSSLPELTPECLGASAQAYTYHIRRRQPLEALNVNTNGNGKGRAADGIGCDGGEAAGVAGPGAWASSARAAPAEGSSQHQQHGPLAPPLLWARGAGRVAHAQGDEIAAAVESSAFTASDNPAATARAFRAVAHLLHGDVIGLEAWASAAATLSLDGYGPPFRLPQQLLLPAAVLKQASPYQSWLDWGLHPGLHYEQFKYNLHDLEEKVFALLGVGSDRHSVQQGGNSGRPAAGSVLKKLQHMTEAAHGAVAAKVDVFAQLDAFAWSVARYKEACPWEVAAPAADERVFHIVQLHPSEVFNSPGVPESVQLQVMRQLRSNFAAALKLPTYLAAAAGGG